MYTEIDMLKIAKRENNSKRRYLVVNPLQGKHIKVSPSKAFHVFDDLAKIIDASYLNENLLLIGFAETATAIGAAVAAYLGAYYIQTTRENMGQVDYLYFSEVHSHAMEQKVVKEDMLTIINKVSRIIFIEDEITTGNTILNIIKLIQELSPNMKFSVGSLLNGMDQKSKALYEEKGIQIHFLMKTNHDRFDAEVENVAEDGSYYIMSGENSNNGSEYQEIHCLGGMDARRLINGNDYQLACDDLWNQICGRDLFTKNSSVLVLGTEEFMYPALYVANKIENLGNTVFYHATTRSPIAVSKNENYPLHARYELPSLYDKDRVTYIYDLGQYDIVFVITDTKCNEKAGVCALMNALMKNENTNIYYVRWELA